MKLRVARTLTGASLVLAMAAVCLLPGFINTVRAAELLGADKAIEEFKLARDVPDKKVTPPPPAAPPQHTWPALVDIYAESSGTLTPVAAAVYWLALYDVLVAMPAAEKREVLQSTRDPAIPSRNSETDGLEARLLRALPPPAAWDALASQIDKRPIVDGAADLPNALLRVLAAKLRNQPAAIQREVAKLKAEALVEQAKGASGPASQLNRVADSLESAWKKEYGGSTEALADFEKFLADRENAGKGGKGKGSGTNSSTWSSSDALDLVHLVGGERAHELIVRGLKVNPPVTQYAGKATNDLAAILALKHVDELSEPVWPLVRGSRDMKLFEALEKRFPAQSRKEGNNERLRITAESNYFLALIKANRLEDARAFLDRAQSVDDLFSTKVMRSRTHDHLIYQVLREKVEAAPSAKCLEILVTLGVSSGRSSETIEFLRSIGEKSSGEAYGTRKLLRRALLAADRVDEGVALLREEMVVGGGPDVKRGALPLELAELGRLLDRPEWIEEGLRAYDKARGEDYVRYIRLAQRLKRADLEEKGRVAYLKSIARKENAHNEIGRGFQDLAKFYADQGRFEDAMTVIKDADVFLATDLADLIYGRSPCGELPALAYSLAAVRRAEGDVEGAREILIAALREDSDSDEMYALLLKTGPEGVEAALDGLFALDAFEERPLVWKAQFLLDQGRLDEAEAAARQAIAIDPSDGEMGKDDRMRVYGVLSGIMGQKGDDKQCQVFADVVQAIRISENADDLWLAGLLSRAISQYERGIRMFSDAYCTHSRLALRAAEAGQMDLARQHYQRAYELMPDSFGRVESHCFGCEGVFSSETARDIASEVFGNLVLTTPDKPQVHYLMGYLLEAKELKTEALQSYQVAVRLDPDYLNAWKKIQTLAETLKRPEEQSSAALAVMRLDPLARHGRHDFTVVQDWRGLWQVRSAALARTPARATGLFPLPASKARLDELLSKADSKQKPKLTEHIRTSQREEAEAIPAAALLKTPSGSALLRGLATVN